MVNGLNPFLASTWSG